MLKRIAAYIRHHHVALLALFVALGGTSVAASHTLLPRNSVGTAQLKKNAVTAAKIKQGSVTKAKIAPATVAELKGPRAKIVTYDATASGTPTITTLGTFLGVTIGASCTIPNPGEAEVTVYIRTTDGSWNVDYTAMRSDGATGTGYASKIKAPPGTLPAGLSEIDSATAAAGDNQFDTRLEFIQLAPSAGTMSWHETASTKDGAQTCHMVVKSIPEPVSAAPTSSRTTARATADSPIRLGPR